MLVLLGAAAYLYLNLFALPCTPYLLGGDQVYFWLDAQHMLYGQRIYQDFLEFTPPGTDLFYFSLFKLFGFRIWVANAAVLALGVAFCWICFSLAIGLMRRNSALLATALFLILVYGKALNATHHWFSVLAVMGAVRVSFTRLNLRTAVLSGAILGLASFFNQTHGAAGLFAFAVFLLWRRSHLKSSWTDLLRNEAGLLFSFVFALLVLNAHLIATVGLRQIGYFQVTYVTTYVVNLSQGSLLGLPKPLSWQTLPALTPYLAVYISLPAVYLLTLWRCLREQFNSSFPWDRTALLAMVGLSFLAEVSLSLNWLRLYAVSLPGIVLLIVTLDQATKLRRYVFAFIWIAVIGLAVRQSIITHRSQSLRASLPGGATALAPQAYEKLQWIMQHTTPGEFFFQAGWPGMYLPLQLRNPLYLNTAYAARPQDAEQAVQQLRAARVPFILWTEHLDSKCDPGRPCNDGIAPIRDYLHRSYVRVRTFPDGDTLWQRTAAHP
ncbi:hypothetical protein [Edaphobacter aggregans]|uniref:hypothetical protein n=1 Tax=Edaphobacter aggregans TaxID=570835 RepID=UPI00054F84E0|nr:hypothetical protein [Edaphobacter aggregans]